MAITTTGRAALLAVALGVVLSTGCGDDEAPGIDGRYGARLTAGALHAVLPQTTAPDGSWGLVVDTKLKYLEVRAPDGGGYSLGIRALDGERLTIEEGGCLTKEGKPAGDAVYTVRRDGDQLRFSPVRDRCPDPDSETKLLTAAAWTAREES